MAGGIEPQPAGQDHGSEYPGPIPQQEGPFPEGRRPDARSAPRSEKRSTHSFSAAEFSALTFPATNKPSNSLSPKLVERRSALLSKISVYEAEHGRANARLAKSLERAFSQACEPMLLDILEQSVDRFISEGKPTGYPLSSFAVLSHSRSTYARLQIGHVTATADLFHKLDRHDPKIGTMPRRWFYADALELISGGMPVDKFKIYTSLLASEVLAGHDPGAPFDMFGEHLNAVNAFFRAAPTDVEIQSVTDLLEHHLNSGGGMAALQWCTELLTTPNLPSGQPRLLLVDLYADTIGYVNGSTVLGSELVATFRELASLGASTEVLRAFGIAAKFFQNESGHESIRRFREDFRELVNSSVHPQLLSNFAEECKTGKINSASEALSEIKRITGFSAATSLYDSSTNRQFRLFLRQLGDATISDSQEWQTISKEELLPYVKLSPTAKRALGLHQRLMDVFHGFGALLWEARRSPTREPALLAQFGDDVAAVKYINSSNPNEFPGKGVLIKNPRLDQLFVADPKDSDPYRAYKYAWPAYRDEFDLFHNAELLFTRGMIVLNCRPDTKFSLRSPSGISHQYSMVIFNDHFLNPGSCSAYLVPTGLLNKRMHGVFVSYEDFRGFHPELPDLNKVISSPEDLLSDPNYKDDIIPIGDPTFVLKEFPFVAEREQDFLHITDTSGRDFLNVTRIPTLTEERKALEKRIKQHNKRAERWENRSALYRNSVMGRREVERLHREYEDLSKKSFELARKEKGHGGAGESAAGYLRSLYGGATPSERLSRRRHSYSESITASDREVPSHPVWDMTESYLNLLDLFRISSSLWHKGHTLGAPIDRSSVSSEEDDSQSSFDSPISQDDNSVSLERGTHDQAIWNPNAVRMLVKAYEWHAQREAGVTDRNQYPLLTIAPTLSYGTAPELTFVLDTYDMSVTINGQRSSFSVGKMNSDDELFWHTTVLPLAADSSKGYRDLRFYSRASLDIH